MKTETECYVLAKEVDGETVYLAQDYGFENDILSALKAGNKITAECVIGSFEEEVCFKHGYKLGFYKSGLEIVPLKVTYEW